MKIPNQRELQQIAFNHQILALKTYWECTAKSYSFLVNDTFLAPDNPLCFKHNHLERIFKLIITIDDKIRDEIVHYSINIEAAKFSASSGKIDNMNILDVKKVKNKS